MPAGMTQEDIQLATVISVGILQLCNLHFIVFLLEDVYF